MTQIVTVLLRHRFQYVERRYSGFVALSFVIKMNAGFDDVRNQWLRLKERLKIDDAGAVLNTGFQPPKLA